MHHHHIPTQRMINTSPPATVPITPPNPPITARPAPCPFTVWTHAQFERSRTCISTGLDVALDPAMTIIWFPTTMAVWFDRANAFTGPEIEGLDHVHVILSSVQMSLRTGPPTALISPPYTMMVWPSGATTAV